MATELNETKRRIEMMTLEQVKAKVGQTVYYVDGARLHHATVDQKTLRTNLAELAMRGWTGVWPQSLDCLYADHDEASNVAHANRMTRKPRRAKWHTAPDGTQCCCTAEDRKYGTGCR